MNKFKIAFVAAMVVALSAFTLNNDKLFEIAKNIEIFVTIYKELNDKYVDEIEPSELMRTGIDAMLESLDPYTNYISESQVTNYRLNNDGKYDGIGANMKQVGDYITLMEPYEGSPAFVAGLRAGDQIKAINGQTTKNRSVEDLNRVVRGFPGTEIRLDVIKAGQSKSELVTVVRNEVSIPNVPHSELLTDDIAYVSLTTFTQGASKNIGEALKKLKKESGGLKGIILDLRSNGGGLLKEAITVSNLFVAKDIDIVSTKGKVADRDKFFKTPVEPLFPDVPLVVLINKRSASASEIVSGSIQDLDRGVLMGQRSFGKGLVQNTHEIGYNSRVKLTTSKYYIPSGRCIQSVEYENGEPKDIEDSRRSTFYTKNKRPVLDGGGVTPDIKLKAKEKSTLMNALLEQNIIFDYVVDFRTKNDSIAPVGEYEFTDFDAFAAYVKSKEFSYKTETESELEDLVLDAKNDQVWKLIQAQIEASEEIIRKEKEKNLAQEKLDIIHEIEKEIATQYYFQKGKVAQVLDNDDEVQQAIKVLYDTAKYEQLLTKG